MADRTRIPSLANGLPQTERAIEYAELMHAGQQRADGAPFILHPREVAALLYYAGAPDHLIAAGVMHDVVEKTDATASDLRRRFGQRITGLVLGSVMMTGSPATRSAKPRCASRSPALVRKP